MEKLFWQHSHSISGNACFSNLQGTILQKSNFPQTCCFLLLSSTSTVLTSPEKIATDFQQLLLCSLQSLSYKLNTGCRLTPAFQTEGRTTNLSSGGSRAPKIQKKEERTNKDHDITLLWFGSRKNYTEYEWGNFTLCIIISSSVFHFLVLTVLVIFFKKWKYNSEWPWEAHLVLCYGVIQAVVTSETLKPSGKCIFCWSNRHGVYPEAQKNWFRHQQPAEITWKLL